MIFWERLEHRLLCFSIPPPVVTAFEVGARLRGCLVCDLSSTGRRRHRQPRHHHEERLIDAITMTFVENPQIVRSVQTVHRMHAGIIPVILICEALNEVVVVEKLRWSFLLPREQRQHQSRCGDYRRRHKEPSSSASRSSSSSSSSSKSSSSSPSPPASTPSPASS